MKNLKKRLKKISNTKKFLAVGALLIFFVLSSVIISSGKYDHQRIWIERATPEKINLRSGDQAKSWAENISTKERCKKIAMKAGATNDVFVPFKTQVEWQAFLANVPDSVEISDCCGVFGDLFGDTFCEG